MAPPPPPAAAVQHTDSMSATRASSVSSVTAGLAPPFQPSPAGWSETSWGSQTELLSISGENIRTLRSEEKTNFRKWFSEMLSKFICLYSCGEKKKIQKIEETVSEIGSLNHHHRLHHHHQFGSDSNRQTDRQKLTVNLIHKVSKNNSKSLEKMGLNLIRSPPRFPPGIHFPSSARLGAGFSFPVERQRDALHIFRPSIFELSLKSGGSAAMDDDDDVASDASSDLFEIECLTTATTTTTNNTATNYPMYHHHCRREDCLEEALRRFGLPSEAPSTEGYEPSEASIEWSVTTAEGFGSVANFSASASDIVEDVRVMRQELQRLGNGGYGGVNDGNGGGRRRLETCRCGLRR